MKDLETLGELSRLFHVAPSALRYWDREGLVRFERGEGNQYRYPTIQTMMDICEVLLMRSCAIPVKEIRRLPDMGAGEIGAMLQKNRRELERQIEELQTAMEKIRRKQELVRRVEELERAGFTVRMERLSAVAPFSFHDPKAVRRFVEDMGVSAVLLDPQGGGEPEFGLFLEEEEAGELLRERDGEPRPYLCGLLRMESGDIGRQNAGEFVAEARRGGFRPGEIIGRYLLSACEEGTRYDFYEGCLRLTP